MRILWQLLEENKKNENTKKNTEEIEQDWEDEMYIERAESVALNKNSSIFDHEEHAINKEKSVFDRTAVFHTSDQ